MQDMVDEINLATAVTQVSAIIDGSGFMSLSSSQSRTNWFSYSDIRYSYI